MRHRDTSDAEPLPSRLLFQPRAGRLSAWCYVLVWAGTLADQLLHVPVAGDVGGMAMLLFLLLEFPNQRRFAKVLFFALVGAGLLGVAHAAHPLPLFLASWRRGAAYGAFFLALTTLRDAAETSPLVRRCGAHLVAQPPGRRYVALTAGGHLFGIILSYGSIELLGSMVTRANTLEAAGGSEPVRTLRARRMLMAIYRGFCVMNCWSPLNLMTAVVSTAVPEAPMRLLMPIALVVSVGMAALGWLEDRISAARRATSGGARPVSRESWTVHLRIAALIALVMLLAEAGSAVFGVKLVTGVTIVVPTVAAGWVLVQLRRYVGVRLGSSRRVNRASLVGEGGGGGWHEPPADGRIARASIPGREGGNTVVALSFRSMLRLLGLLRRRAVRFLWRVPHFRSEATVLAGSGFMGVAIGGALPTTGMAPLLAHLPAIALPLLVPVLLIATGQIGLNPVAVVALFGAIIPHPAALGVPPAVFAFACMLGWGLAINMTPMSASAITTARWARVSPWTVSTAWNATFTASALLLAWGAIAVLFAVWPT